MTDWQLPEIWAYWDERSRTISRLSTLLGELPADEAAAATETIAKSVTDLVNGLPDEQLKNMAHVVTDDLYKAASAIEFWGGPLVPYLTASAGTFFSLLRSRGYIVHYVVDNSVMEYERVLSVYGPWFHACGITYICPQEIVTRLMKADGAEADAFMDKIPFYIAEARHIANMVVEDCAKDWRHFLFLDVDAQKDSFTTALALAGAPGVVSVFRNEAPMVGSHIQVRLPGSPAKP